MRLPSGVMVRLRSLPLRMIDAAVDGTTVNRRTGLDRLGAATRWLIAPIAMPTASTPRANATHFSDGAVLIGVAAGPPVEGSSASVRTARVVRHASSSLLNA